METNPVSSFDKHNTRYNSTAGSYIGKVMLGSIPKMFIIVSATYIASFVAVVN